MKHDIFVSYKREDLHAVAKLVQRLEQSGFSVWWDRSLLAGGNWRSQIHQAIDEARCVIVIWTENSTGPDGDFVRDEASQGKQRGILIPVTLQETPIPLGFGEIQSIDLTHWKGSARDLFYCDLVAAINAVVSGQAAPRPRGPTRRALKRAGMVLSPLLLLLLATNFNVASIQHRSCSFKVAQPQLADFCGLLGWGGKPTREERLAWQALPEGNCTAILEFRRRYESSPLREIADSCYAARTSTQAVTWTPEKKALPLMVLQGDDGATDEDEARELALQRAQGEARQICSGFAVTTTYRLDDASANIKQWNCEQSGSHYLCGGRGEAMCEVQLRSVTEIETC